MVYCASDLLSNLELGVVGTKPLHQIRMTHRVYTVRVGHASIRLSFKMRLE